MPAPTRVATVPVSAPMPAAIPGKVGAAPTCPGMPAAPVPEPRPAAPPAVIVRAIDPAAADKDCSAVHGVTAITGVVVIIGVAGSRWVIAWAIVVAWERNPDAN